MELVVENRQRIGQEGLGGLDLDFGVDQLGEHGEKKGDA